MSGPNSGKNRLGAEKSPYLLQHKDNPVWWYAWGSEAFDAARAQNKPIFLSIGYSTCYWCHVMEKDSFEKNEVAEVLNQHYICIKVDREERPDVDQVYMEAVVTMNGHGGWPMSVVLTPELKPFWSGTFLYQEQFLHVLNGLIKIWNEQPQRVFDAAASLTQVLSQAKENQAPVAVNAQQALEGAVGFYAGRFDATYGGFGGAPKFPQATVLELLLRAQHRSPNDQTKQMVNTTLTKMARGGIYDHLGGGFARYSTDEAWTIPHFEKMLYDNAQLVNVYLEAYQIFSDDLYAFVARETLEYVLREMTAPNAGFYSAQDAGEVGKEGEFYVWTKPQIGEVLGTESAEKFCTVFGVTEHGNFEHSTNVLTFESAHQWDEKYSAEFKPLLERLYQARALRLAPHLDDKIICSWNALMISAFCKGYQVLGEQRFLDAARSAATFILSNLHTASGLRRFYRDSVAATDACLDDYVNLIQALIDLFESTSEVSWIQKAQQLQREQDTHFWDSKEKSYWYSPNRELIIQKKEFHDNALPSSNGIALSNLLRLSLCFHEVNYAEKADFLLKNFSHALSKFPAAVCTAVLALDFCERGGDEIVLVDDSNEVFKKELLPSIFKKHLPCKLVYQIQDSGKKEKIPQFAQHLYQARPGLYICKNKTCAEPISELQAAKQRINSLT